MQAVDHKAVAVKDRLERRLLLRRAKNYLDPGRPCVHAWSSFKVARSIPKFPKANAIPLRGAKGLRQVASYKGRVARKLL